MRRKLTIGLVSVLAVLVPAITATPAGAARGESKSVKPSIRITGISVDTYDATPGTRITYTPNRPVNACYEIGGPSQAPAQVDVVFFIHAVGIPQNATTTLDVVTPWDSQSRPGMGDEHPVFSKAWFTDKGHGLAAIYGGSDAPDNFYTFDDEGTRGDAFNGDYSVTTTVKVHGSLLRAHATLKIDCG
jgi:hypothetical protein